jgi:hypothetical protein
MRRAMLVVVLALGCAHAPVESAAPGWKLLSATPGTDQIQFRSDVRLRWATVTDTSARGPDLDLRRTPGKIEGTTFVERLVELTEKGNEMLGRVAGDDFGLTLREDGDEMRATGVVGGMQTTFWLSPALIRGSIGPCSFQLGWSGGSYLGGRQCGPRSDTISLQNPAGLARSSDPEVASLLAILVGW